jgi:NADPH2:quinone reductase
MRAIMCESWRDFSDLEIKDVPRPALRPRSVRIKVAAAGVSFATQLVVAGKYQRKPPLPFTPGTEIVGTVLEAASDADAPPPGTRVFAVVDWGGMAEEAIADDIHTIAIPDGLPMEPAIGFPISYPTAGAALLWRGRIKSGDWVLVHGAAGGVGLAAVEIAKACGAKVIARAGTAKHNLLRAYGADVVLDSAAPFRDAVRAATGGRGVDCLVDTIGGPAFDESLRCLADGGNLVVVGFAGGGIPTLQTNILLLKNIGVIGVNWGTYVGWSPGDGRRDYAPAARALWDQLMVWWQQGALKPEIHATYPLEQFREAMAEVSTRRSAGRVILRP